MPSSADLKVLVWDTPLRSSGDVAELVGRCVEGGARAVLLDAKGVSAELLDLRSGVTCRKQTIETGASPSCHR